MSSGLTHSRLCLHMGMSHTHVCTQGHCPRHASTDTRDCAHETHTHTCTVAHPSHAGTHVCTRQHVPHVFIRLNDYLLSILMRQGPCRALVMLQRTKQTKPPARMELTVWGQSHVARQIDEIHNISGGDKCYGENEAGRGGRGARRAGRNCASKQDGRARSHAHRHEGGEPRGCLGRAFRAVRSQCKGPEARACWCLSTSPRATQTCSRTHTCTRTHTFCPSFPSTDPKAGPGQCISPSALAGDSSN